MEDIILLSAVTGFFTLAAWACASFPLAHTFLRKTFLPLTKQEFWFPPCPFCWAMRAGAAALVVMLVTSAFAAEIACPKPAKSCKILTFTPEEEQAMMAPKMILDTAATARLLDLKAIADYFSKKFQDAQPVAGEAAPDVPLPQPRPDTAPK